MRRFYIYLQEFLIFIVYVGKDAIRFCAGHGVLPMLFDLTELMPYLKVVSRKRSSFTPSGTAYSTGGTAHICTSMTVGLNATWAQLNEMHHSLDFQEASAIIRQANRRISLTHLRSAPLEVKSTSERL